MPSYFQSYQDYFWQWEDATEVLAIPTGNTIAYKPLIFDIIEKISVQGLPPFGSLLLAVIATNPSAAEDIGHIDKIFRTLTAQLPQSKQFLDEVLEMMQILSVLPQTYKTGNMRVLMLQTLFNNCHNIYSLKDSKSIFNDLKGNGQLNLNIALKQGFNSNVYQKEFRTFALLKKRFPDAKTIIERMAGLPTLPEETLQLEESPELPSKYFVQELIDESKTFHVGSLIKSIWSGLHIPYHLSLPSEQPMGGVSDITNKGDFGRLLISEFANDDLLFLSRLANNEALYLNREIPPASNQQERIILIDVSIKNWGTPKNIAFAIALAIAKHPKTNITCRIFVVGNAYREIYIHNIDAIIAGLQILEGCLHPAQGLEKFCKEQVKDKNHEIFLISATETLQLPSMLKTLADLHEYFTYWIYTDNLGEINVYKKQQKGKKHVQYMKLALAELWNKEKPTPVPSPPVPKVAAQYPILFPSTMNPKRILSTHDGTVFQITQNRDLLKLRNIADKHNKGWELVYENLPFISGEFEIGLTSTGVYLLLAFNAQNRELHLLNLSTGEKKSAHFKGWKHSSYNFIFYQDCFYYLYDHSIKHWKIELGKELEINLQEGVPTELKAACQQRKEKQEQLARVIQSTAGVLRNLKQVFINEQNELVFNNHKLCINPQICMQLLHSYATKKVFEARASSKTEFTFPNGSTVSVSRSGMLILKSYTQGHTYDLVLKSAGTNKLALIRSLKDNMDLGLLEAKNFVDAIAPITIKSYLTKTESEDLLLKLKLENTDGAEFEIVPNQTGGKTIYIPSLLDTPLGISTESEFAGSNYFLPEYDKIPLRILKAEHFWKTHIETFINGIKAYGTKA